MVTCRVIHRPFVRQGGATSLLKVFWQRGANGWAWRACLGLLVLSFGSPPSVSRLWKPLRSDETHGAIMTADGNLLITVIAASH